MRAGIGWIVLGVAVSVGAWRMDRLQSLNIEPWSAPGLVPGVLGVLMALFGCGLMLSSRDGVAQAEPIPWGRLLGVLGLTVLFGFVALGRMPFVLAAALLIFVWIAMLSWSQWVAAGQRGRGLLRTALIAGLASIIVSHLFQDVFLVRLP